MKKVFGNILAYAIGLYLISLTVMVPYYNWHYAKEHGFVKWMILGEVVATAKSVVWPYFVFFNHRASNSTPDERHYVNSKKACDEAMKIIIKVNDITRLSPDDKTKVSDLLSLAISEANMVNLTYLKKAHPQFPEKYEDYKHAMTLLAQGLRAENTRLILAGVYGYNEFAEWMRAHGKDLSF